MAKYLFQVSFTLDGIRGVKAEGGSARRAAAAEAIKSAGGSLDAFWFAFGETDVYVIADMPDNTAAAAVALTVTAGAGATVRTTPLVSPEEIDAASRTTVQYRPPGH